MQTLLVSDQADHALIEDPNLVNPWGIGLNPDGGDFSISDNGTGVATSYGGAVNQNPLTPSNVVVSIPGGSPTGQAANTTGIKNVRTPGFTISSGSSSAAADFLFASASGKISGWNPNVPPPAPSTSAQLAAIAAGANFTGLAIGETTQQGPLLYAADFHNGVIDVFNTSFQPVTLSGSFSDPNLPIGFAPYNIENLFGQIYVAYARQDPSREHALVGPGSGQVDVYDQSGNLVNRLIVGTQGQSTSPLNAPWGMTVAPSSFGNFGGDLLVANTGDGHINAFNLQSGAFLGAVLDPAANPMSIDGLRGLTVGNDLSAGSSSEVYFTADPNNGAHGLFGSLTSIDGNPLNAVGAQFPAGFGVPFNGTVATFSDINGNNSGAFPDVAMIDWGDGANSTGTVTQIGANQYLVKGSHTYTITGSYHVTVSITDNRNDTATANSVAVVSPASGSLAAAGANFSATVGKPFQGNVATFTDGDGNTSPAAYTATIDWGDGAVTTGAISASGSGFQVAGGHTYNTAGSNQVVVTIHDSDGDAATITATATVTANDVLTVSPAPASPTEGIAFSGAVATFTDSNAATSSGDFSTTIVWGDGATAAGTVSGSGGRFTLVGNHTFAEEGNYTASVSVAQNGSSAAGAASVTIQVADAALTLTGARISSSEGATFSGTVATLTDANPSAPASDFTASINWGDGTTGTGAVAANGSGGFNVVGQHAYTEGGAYTIDVSVADVGGSQASATSSATVADYPLTGSPMNISGTEGATFSGAVATFTDADPDGGSAGEYTASIDWGDGATTAGTVTGSAGSYTVAGMHLFADEASGVIVHVRDTGGATATINSPATIADADVLLGMAAAVSATEGLPLSMPLATFSDAYTANSASDFTAMIDWGDGATTTGAVSGGGASYTVSGRHTYAEEGTQTAHVSLRDDAPGTASATATVSVQIADAPLAANAFTITPTEVSTFNGVVASFNDGNTTAPISDFTATIDWGDGATSGGTVVAAGGGLFHVRGSHAFGEEGATTHPTVVVHDVGGSSVTIHGTATVIDAPLAINVLALQATEQSPAAFTVATFTDLGPLDPLGDYGATIDWGDGTSSAATLSLNDGVFTVSGSHTYSDEGHFTLSVTASETGGSTAGGHASALVVEQLLSTGTRGTPDERWINELFHDLLGRQADPAALSFFASLAASGSRPQVVDDIVHSREYLADEVDSLYQRYLDRAADSSGQSYFVSVLQNGGTAEDVAAVLAASPEFFALHGATDSGFLDALFEDALERPIDPGARQFFDQALATGVTRQQAAAIVLSSDEYRAEIVAGLYQQLLDRSAGANGLAFWTSQLKNGAQDDQIIAGIAASDEYFSKTVA